MRSIASIFVVAILGAISPSVALAQSCELLNDCPPKPEEHNFSRQTRSRHAHRAHHPVRTVASVQADFVGAPVYIFGDEDTAAASFETIVAKLAAYIKTSNFKRNPAIATDENGMYTWQVDVVASFEQNKSVNGYFHFAVNWDGAIWPFASKDNAEKFVANPTKYAPVYGGHCAYCLALDDITAGDVVEVYKDKLYLFADDEYRKLWLKSPNSYIEKADRRWQSLPISRLKPVEADSSTKLMRAALKQ